MADLKLLLVLGLVTVGGFLLYNHAVSEGWIQPWLGRSSFRTMPLRTSRLTPAGDSTPNPKRIHSKRYIENYGTKELPDQGTFMIEPPLPSETRRFTAPNAGARAGRYAQTDPTPFISPRKVQFLPSKATSRYRATG